MDLMSSHSISQAVVEAKENSPPTESDSKMISLLC